MLIRSDDPCEPRIRALLERHLERARAETAPGSAHALDLEQLRSPDIAFFAAWEEGEPLGVIALRRLSSGHGEVKSMYTAERARRRGIAAALLERVIAEARAVSIGAPDYRPDPNSVFMTLELGIHLTRP